MLPPGQVLVLFGATGDLAGRKILPALSSLALGGRLPEPFAVPGYAVEQFSRRRVDDARWPRFAETLFYLAGDFGTPGCFTGLRKRLGQMGSGGREQGLRLYYCATPPDMFTLIARRLVQALAGPPLAIRDGLLFLSPRAAWGEEGEPGGGALTERVAAAVELLRRELAARPFAAPDAGGRFLDELGLEARAVAAAERVGLAIRISGQVVLAPGGNPGRKQQH